MFKRLTKYALVGLALTTAASLDAKHNPAAAGEPFLAEIIMFGSNFAPRGWAFCDGQILPISQNTALFSLLGTTYGGDGRTSFGLPDLRGRVAIHPGPGFGLTLVRLGEKGGVENVTLTTAQMPSHDHQIDHGHGVGAVMNASSANGDVKTPAGNVLAVAKGKDYSTAAPDVQMHPSAFSVVPHAGNSATSGGGQAHENRQPYLGINHIIALVGVFPSRN
jgi:microcystin-dependent protein